MQLGERPRISAEKIKADNAADELFFAVRYIVVILLESLFPVVVVDLPDVSVQFSDHFRIVRMVFGCL